MLKLLLRKVARAFGIRLVMMLRRPALAKLINAISRALGLRPLPPRYVSRTTREWMEQNRQTANFQEVAAPGTIIRTAPKTVEPAIHWHLRQTMQRPAPELFVATIPNGRVVGSHGHIIAGGNTVLADVSREWFADPQQHSLLFRFRLPPITPIQGTVATVAAVSGGTYYHWMTDVLPRLGILEKAGTDFAAIDAFIFNGTNAPFARESLDLLGIPESKRRFTGTATHFECERLLLPSPASVPGWTPAWVPEFLRSRLLPKVQPAAERLHIFVSRQRSKYRKFVNDGEVRHLLIERGFKEVFLEELPFMEQVRLFASAAAVVSPHGAGLTNLAFCAPGTKVIEIFSPNYVNECFWGLASQIGLDYYYLLGRGARPQELHDPHRVEEDIEVDIEQLKQTLVLAGV